MNDAVQPRLNGFSALLSAFDHVFSFVVALRSQIQYTRTSVKSWESLSGYADLFEPFSDFSTTCSLQLHMPRPIHIAAQHLYFYSDRDGLSTEASPMCG